MGKVIMISSGKDGVGKSSLAALLAEVYCEKGKTVLIIEFENGLRSQNLYVNSTDSLFDLSDVLNGRCELDDAVATSSLSAKLKVLFAGNTRESLNRDLFEPLLLTQVDKYDIVLIDTDSSDETISVVSSFSMYNLIVSTNDRSGIQDSKYICDLLYEKNAPNVRLVLNRIKPDYIKRGAASNLDDCIDTIGAQLIGVIPENIDLAYSTNNGKRLNKKSLIHEIISNITERLDGSNVPLSYM
ncbi:MAG: P-loop NTPase [Oscillospiraceae bacterium]|nr:P-loop NTPase [Oscillospiraceae bacterium]